ncbi:MAG TPA: cyclic 2,3-diphosphoglycerate synthase [Candidatus Krumholzibacteria bacterium]|nr:cyclic 2,3-diphosphoglycerate synthase [Candidatus Krumholzibacteria bacterium]HRX50688.1 cyclic 2,3-diphosphoglycerate synthase [Candidatus Krumholzibacteria bacterium]
MSREKVIIIGAAGRDFHNFNCVFRDNEAYEVVAFTAAQIPDIDGRAYPAALAGKLYPEGIPIHAEEDLPGLIAQHGVECCVFSYSDVAYEDVMHKAALVNACGADFKLLGERQTELKSSKPVISICAVRTGCGKSQTTRLVSEILQKAGKKVVAVRHPMPYGDLAKQAVQRFAALEDLEKHQCTIEEMEEYEPHIVRGNVIYAGVDYEAILREAEKEADVILWDGGNNDTPFFKPDMHIVVADPHRAGHELSYFPGETNVRLADVVIINKVVEAQFDDIAEVRDNVRSINPECVILDAASPLTVDDPDLIQGRSCLVVEDGPTLTHGGMAYGAGVVAALRNGAEELVDPRPWVTGKLAETFEIYPEIGTLLPAMGYGDEQKHDLEATINAVDCDTVVIGTPIDLNRIIDIKKPTVRVGYDLQIIGRPNLEDLLAKFTK